MAKPVQARSRATEEKILAALERLLEDKRFEDVAVTELAAEAGVSVGGVYARFGSKDALLTALHARYEAYRTEHLSQAFDPELWRDADLAARVRGIVGALVTLMRERRALLRTFLLRYWSRPEETEGDFGVRLQELYDQAVGLMLDRRDEIGAPDPARAARTALAVVAGAARDMVVMKPAPGPGAVDASDRELVHALTRAALGVLLAESERSDR
jgi:AcrR family transcriptional regulator